MSKRKLTLERLCQEAATFAEIESTYPEPTLYGVTDGKAIGTYLEHKFRAHLETKYTVGPSSSAAGIDFPGLQVDMKVKAITQPQSSCPFKSARQKIFGLGYSVLVFVYEKKDDSRTATAVLNILHTVFLPVRVRVDVLHRRSPRHQDRARNNSIIRHPAGPSREAPSETRSSTRIKGPGIQSTVAGRRHGQRPRHARSR